MNELKETKRVCKPNETLLVVDAMTGQEAANLVSTFSSFPGMLLATSGEYSHFLTSYWLHVQYIPIYWQPVCHTWSILRFPGILLATSGVYSHFLTSYWSHVECTPISWHPIGHTCSIFPFTDIPSVPRGVCSCGKYLPHLPVKPPILTAENIPSPFEPTSQQLTCKLAAMHCIFPTETHIPLNSHRSPYDSHLLTAVNSLH
jgi:hypothetical protein